VVVIIEVVPGKTLTEEEVLKHAEGLPRYKRPQEDHLLTRCLATRRASIEKPKLRKIRGLGEAFKMK